MNKEVILYEVYSKRAIHEPIDTLVVLDRDRSRKKAVKSAREWGGVVFRIRARITQRQPMIREVLESELVFVHKPRKPANQERDTITRKQLMGKLRSNSKSTYKGFRR